MAPSLTLPDATVSMTLDELRTIQSIASAHITFSLTLACPLKCAHCIVNAGPSLARTTMPMEVAASYAAQMPELASAGVRSISFTGGEPLLAFKQLHLLANAAHAAGITCGLVTAAHWGTSAERAAGVVSRLMAVRCWDVSVDAYHEPWVSLDQVKTVCEAVLAAGRRVTIRFTHNEPPTPQEERILEFIATLPDAAFSCQRVRAVGRGEALGLQPGHRHNPWVKPCLTQGLVVRYDGSIAPCCLNLVEARQHAFQLGDARNRPLVEILRAFRAMPLLQLIRAVGFADAIEWLRDAGLREHLPETLPDEVCEICTLIMKDQTLIDHLVRRTEEPEMQLKIAVLVSRTLGEHHMLASVLDHLAPVRESIPEFAVAEAWQAHAAAR